MSESTEVDTNTTFKLPVSSGTNMSSCREQIFPLCHEAKN